MKLNLLLLLLVSFDLDIIFCDDTLLSKFHQNEYKIKDVRIQLMSYDKHFYNVFQVTAFKYNRSTTAHNATINHKVDVTDRLEVLVQVYKFLSNEYREFPIRFQVNMQRAYEANVIGVAAIIKCGNFTSCYFYKDISYHICNFVIDETHLPPLIPSGRYKIEVEILYLSRQIAVVDIFGEVYTPIDYPKK